MAPPLPTRNSPDNKIFNGSFIFMEEFEAQKILKQNSTIKVTNLGILLIIRSLMGVSSSERKLIKFFTYNKK